MRFDLFFFFERENIYTVPNLISLTRAASSPLLGYLVLTGRFDWALGLFLVAGISDGVRLCVDL